MISSGARGAGNVVGAVCDCLPIRTDRCGNTDDFALDVVAGYRELTLRIYRACERRNRRECKAAGRIVDVHCRRNIASRIALKRAADK